MADVYNCTVLSVTMLNDSTCDMRVLAPEICAAAKPGMFVHIKCEGFMLRRPISICGAEGDILRLIIDRRGGGTKWLTERKKFDIIDILGPLGKGFDTGRDKKEHILVVGGGIGSPPVLYAAREAYEASAVLGFRSADAAILLGDFSEVCKTVQVSTDDGTLGHRGFVTDIAEMKIKGGGIDRVLACGPTPMLKGIKALCERYDVPLEISLEERMGCGIGACLVCACKTKAGDGYSYSHVCKDGPVFNAGEVELE